MYKDNILVGPSGEALLCDFGLSRVRHELTRTHTVMQSGGRPRFVAPEQSSGSEETFRTTPSSDIYSLAMTLVNVLTLALPFAGYRRDFEAVHAAENGERPSRPSSVPFQLADALIDGMWALFDTMWNHKPADRATALMVKERTEDICGTALRTPRLAANSLPRATSRQGSLAMETRLHGETQTPAPSDMRAIKVFMKPTP